MKRYLCLLLLFLLPVVASADGLTIEVDEVTGFSENEITIYSPASGLVQLSVTDEFGTYRTWSEELSAGKNTILWDGLGFHEEPLCEGYYTLSAVLWDEFGEHSISETELHIGKNRNALLFALPKKDKLYLGSNELWSCEMRIANSGGTIVTEIYHEETPDILLGTKANKIKSGYMITYTWDGTIKGKRMEPGNYLLRFYEKSNPAYVREAVVEVSAEKRQQDAVDITGSIMPQVGMSDWEIWELMKKPSVVANLKEQTNHLNIRNDKGKGTILGTIHGQSQAVEVIRIEGKYAFIGAWNHESGDYIEGWVELKWLKVVQPNTEYGLLIDKTTQTMTVFYRGDVLGTIPISTGLITSNKLIRETSAGSFLTVDRINNFVDDKGFCFDYAIRYDGGNLIHQIGYQRQKGKKDFSIHAAQLGTKASQGCIRVSNIPDQGGINAYWLYTHLPYGTRVIILDDPEQRQIQKMALGEVDGIPPVEPITPPALSQDETEVVLTFGGDVVLGTREAWWSKEEAFPAYLQKYGMDYPFKNLLPIFRQDDMTILNLECVLKPDADGEDMDKEYRFRGLPQWTECLSMSSVEQVSIANNHYIDYGMVGRDSTRAALDEAEIGYSGFEYTYIFEKDGRKIGFAGCRETVFKQDPNVVYRDIRRLKQAGCDVVIYTCHWGKEYSPIHNRQQRQIAITAVAAGADIVIGGHPHVVQGVDNVGSVPIIYSLGNLMFGGTIDMTTFDGMLVQLRLRFDDNGYCGCTLKLIPVLTSSSATAGVNDYCPLLAEGKDKERILKKVQDDTPFVLMEEMYLPRR